ncbi:hypothetical protein BDK61_4770 [Haloarcula quadrata]|uniref:Uncharacterized protein n=1 Tax=Haloarcula quadrata TaxID=182779 RepID=A0A495QMI8_9EURY|nr:hypothetical protein BDK61_4770 [Haloarcula quadrata]
MYPILTTKLCIIDINHIYANSYYPLIAIHLCLT